VTQRCGNCEKIFKDKEIEVVLADIEDFFSRVDPGGIVPYGECPECGSFVYPVKQLFKLEINVGNDAMQTNLHLAAALIRTAKQLEEGKMVGAIMDENGNHVGDYDYAEGYHGIL
jgi:hypothetical protein